MKSYAVVFPAQNLMQILYDYGDNKKKVVEFTLPNLIRTGDTDIFQNMLSTVKEKIEPSTKICISMSSDLDIYEQVLTESATNIFLENYEIVSEDIIKSLEVFVQAGYNLNNENIIYVLCKTQYCYVWQNSRCTGLEFIGSNEELERMLITIESTPTVFLYEKGLRNSFGYKDGFDVDFLNNLLPDCTILEYQYRVNKNGTFLYPQLMEIRKENSNLKNTSSNEIQNKINKKFPKTDIHVGFCLSTVSASYYYNAKRKEFHFSVDKDNEWNEVERILKMAKARLNGEFGCFCSMNLVSDEKNDIKRAKECGFKKAEIIDSEKADLFETLGGKFKSTDIVWVEQYKFRAGDDISFNIWKGYTIVKKNIKQTKFYPKPNFMVYQEEYTATKFRSYFPKCQFFKKNSFDNTTILKYAEKMQNETLYVTEHETRAPKENKMKQHSHNETEYCFMETEQSTLNKSDNTNAKIENSGEVLKELMPSAFSDTRYFTMSTKKISNKIKINAVGIDLGTSRCCAAVNRNNGIEAFPLDNTGERQLPSYVAYDEENVICGIVALKRLRNYSKSTIFDSKRIIGRSLNEIEIDLFWPFGLSEKDGKVQMEVQKFNGINKDLVFGAVTPEEVATSLLKHIKQKAEEIQSTTLKQCVITIPAAFNESQKNATMKAAKDAGWEEIELLPEPVAAAFTYFVKRPIPSNSNILVFDLGGGTLDVCIFKIKNNQMEVMSNTGDSKFGGRDFDTVLINYFRNALLTKYGISLVKHKKYLLMIKCQEIKESLSVLTKAGLDIDDYDPNQSGIITITREEFEKMTQPLLNKVKNTLQSALYHSKCEANQIDKVLLAGGGSRMPVIKTLLKSVFLKAEHCCEEHPDEVVAIGAAHYAYKILCTEKQENCSVI